MRKVELPPLPYVLDSLKSFYDRKTLELHHGKHHRGYVTGLNAALDRLATARDAGEWVLAKHLEREIAFHGAGHLLHAIFWHNLSPNSGDAAEGPLATTIARDFGSLAAFDSHSMPRAGPMDQSCH